MISDMCLRTPIVITTIALIILTAPHASAGDLDPPPGPLGPTMVSLEKLAPGRCVNELPGAPDAVHVISASGKYFLSGNIAAPGGGHGILIDADDVTLNLNGFSLLGAPGSLDGIHVIAGLARGIKINSGIGGIPTPAGGGSRIAGFGGDGLHAGGISSLSVSGVIAENNGGDGFEAITECDPNKDEIVTFARCIARSNGGHGVSTAAGAGGGFCSYKVDCPDLLSCMNGLDGLHITSAERVRLNGVRCLSNGEDGIDAEMVARGAKEGFIDITVSESNFNGAHGVTVRAGPNDAGTTSENKEYSFRVTACGNGLDGFHAQDLVEVTFDQCSAAKNTGVGFYAITQPGQPQYGNITFERSQATENGSQGALLLLPADGSARVHASGGAFNGNGAVAGGGGAVAGGLEIDTSGGAPDPAAPGVLDVELDGVTFTQNDGDGARVRIYHQTAMHTIRNIKAIGNGGSGVDVGPPDGAAPVGSLDVRLDHVHCSSNGADGARVGGSVIVDNGDFPRNIGNGLAVSGFPGTGYSGSSCRRSNASGNGADGISMLGVQGGEIDECTAHGNGGTGIVVADSPVPGGAVTFGVRIDRCFASNNATGIAVSGENIVFRCGGSHNFLANLALDPFVFAGPSASSPTWTEVKPYAWP